jgi:CRP-like cAMP-binding protein
MLNTERSILSAGTELNVARGEYLFRRQQEADYVFFLKEGTLELSDESHPPKVIDRRSCFFGLEEMLLDRPHPYNARVLDRAVVLAFDKPQIQRLLAQDPKTHRYFLHKLVDHLGQSGRRFE